MQRIVIEVPDEVADTIAEVARTTGLAPDTVTCSLLEIGMQTAGAIGILHQHFTSNPPDLA